MTLARAECLLGVPRFPRWLLPGRPTLLKLQARVAEPMAQNPKQEVTKAKNALRTYEKRLEEIQELEALPGI